MEIGNRLERLERRLRIAEDRTEILELLALYAPLVDSGMADEAAALWCEGGGYGFSDPASGARLRLAAPDGLADMYRSSAHRGMIGAGCGHFASTPILVVDGDQAEAVGYTFVARHDGEGWAMWRAAVNHWILRRTEKGWRIVERMNRALDGSEQTHELMRKAARLRQTTRI